jgi:hypothetical protein
VKRLMKIRRHPVGTSLAIDLIRQRHHLTGLMPFQLVKPAKGDQNDQVRYSLTLCLTCDSPRNLARRTHYPRYGDQCVRQTASSMAAAEMTALVSAAVSAIGPNLRLIIALVISANNGISTMK